MATRMHDKNARNNMGTGHIVGRDFSSGKMSVCAKGVTKVKCVKLQPISLLNVTLNSDNDQYILGIIWT